MASEDWATTRHMPVDDSTWENDSENLRWSTGNDVAKSRAKANTAFSSSGKQLRTRIMFKSEDQAQLGPLHLHVTIKKQMRNDNGRSRSPAQAHWEQVLVP